MLRSFGHPTLRAYGPKGPEAGALRMSCRIHLRFSGSSLNIGTLSPGQGTWSAAGARSGFRFGHLILQVGDLLIEIRNHTGLFPVLLFQFLTPAAPHQHQHRQKRKTNKLLSSSTHFKFILLVVSIVILRAKGLKMTRLCGTNVHDVKKER